MIYVILKITFVLGGSEVSSLMVNYLRLLPKEARSRRIAEDVVKTTVLASEKIFAPVGEYLFLISAPYYRMELF